jgi:hypothetical protein
MIVEIIASHAEVETVFANQCIQVFLELVADDNNVVTAIER